MSGWPNSRLWLAMLAAAPVVTGTAQAQQQGAGVPSDGAPAQDLPATLTPDSTVTPTGSTTADDYWTGTLSAGLAKADGFDTGDFQSLALTRQHHGSYWRGTLSRYRNTVRQFGAQSVSNYLVATLGAGGNWAGWLIDGYASAGRQAYGTIRQTSGNRSSNGPQGSAYYALGLSVARSVTPVRGWFLTPSLSGSYAHGRSLRPAPGNGADFDTAEPAWNGAGTVRLDHRISANRPSYLGAYAAARVTSNARSDLLPIAGPPSGRGGPPALQAVHVHDVWAELGVTAIVSLSDRLWIEGFASRTVGQVTADSSSGGIGFGVRF